MYSSICTQVQCTCIQVYGYKYNVHAYNYMHTIACMHIVVYICIQVYALKFMYTGICTINTCIQDAHCTLYSVFVHVYTYFLCVHCLGQFKKHFFFQQLLDSS